MLSNAHAHPSRPGAPTALARLQAILCLFAVCGACADTSEPEQLGPAMEEVAGDVGLGLPFPPARDDCDDYDFRNTACIVASVTGAAAVGDCDGDGWADVYLSRPGDSDLLLRNVLGARLEDVSVEAGIEQEVTASNGAAFVDVDSDGDLDLAVASMGGSRHWLYLNRGDCTFDERGVERGVAAPLAAGFHRGTSVAVADLNSDAYLDLIIAQWMPVSELSLLDFVPTPTQVFFNRGAAAPGFFEPGGLPGVDFSRRSVFALNTEDLDGDGLFDLGVVGDFDTAAAFWNDADAGFALAEQHPLKATSNPMGSTVGDVDGDGTLDWFVSAVSCDSCATRSGNLLVAGRGGRTFVDGTDAVGVRVGFFGWGAAFFDLENDGDLDLLQTNGFLHPEFAEATGVDFERDPTRLWMNSGTGAMQIADAEIGVDDTGQGRGVLVFDMDRDGDQDVLIAHHGAPPLFYRNNAGQEADWLRVRVADSDGPGTEGLGARVELMLDAGSAPIVRTLASVSHFQGQSERVAHFGLGDGPRSVAEVRVIWPNGHIESVRDVEVNTVLTVQSPELVVAPVVAWLDIGISGDGHVDPNGQRVPVRRGETVRIVASPAPGSDRAFSGWQGPGGGDALERVIDSNELEVGSVTTVRAVFDGDPADFVTIEATAGGTTHPLPGRYPLAPDQAMVVTALAASNFVFAGWTNATEVGVSTTVRGGSVTATFEPRDLGLPQRTE